VKLIGECNAESIGKTLKMETDCLLGSVKAIAGDKRLAEDSSSVPDKDRKSHAQSKAQRGRILFRTRRCGDFYWV